MSRNNKKKKNNDIDKTKKQKKSEKNKTKIIELQLSLEGSMTNLPDSQRIFGYLMDQLNKKSVNNTISKKGQWSKEDVTNFIKSINPAKSKEENGEQIICMVSNLMPKGYLPMPKEFILKKLNEKIIPYNENKIKEENKKLQNQIEQFTKDKNEEQNQDYIFKENQKKIIEYEKLKNNISSKAIYKALKTMDFIKEEDLNKLILEIKEYTKSEKNYNGNIGSDKLKRYNYITKNQSYIKKINIESDSLNIPGLPNRLFNLPIIEYKNKDGQVNKEFCFYVIVEKNTILAQYLMQLKADNGEKYFLLGPKTSQGYNNFYLKNGESIKIDDYNIKPNKKLYLNMGMLLPQEDILNWKDSDISIYSSNRRSFEIPDPIDKVISFIDAGSVIATNKNYKSIKDYKHNSIGKCIDNKYNVLYPDAIIFGNSYLKQMEV